MSDDYTIQLPISRQLPDEGLTKVDPDSPIQIRRLVEKFALYFKREFHYDFPQFDAKEKGGCRHVPYSAFLFHKLAPDKFKKANDNPRRVYGSCCFRWREWKDHEPCWVLDWIWFHPYFRGRGKLDMYWGYFKEEFAPFFLETPISFSMRRFVEKRGDELPIIR